LIDRARYSPLLFTRFVNAPDGPYDRFLDWHSCNSEPETDIVSELQPFAQTDFIFSKSGLCGMPDELTDYLASSILNESLLSALILTCAS